MTHPTSGDRKWPKSDSSIVSHVEVAVGQKLPYTAHFASYKAVSRCGGSHVTQNDVTWPQVTGNDPEVTSLDRSHQKVAVEGRKLAYTVHFTSYKVVAHSRWEWRDRKWRHVTSGDRKLPGSDVIWPVVTWKWL